MHRALMQGGGPDPPSKLWAGVHGLDHGQMHKRERTKVCMGGSVLRRPLGQLDFPEQHKV